MPPALSDYSDSEFDCPPAAKSKALSDYSDSELDCVGTTTTGKHVKNSTPGRLSPAKSESEPDSEPEPEPNSKSKSKSKSKRKPSVAIAEVQKAPNTHNPRSRKRNNLLADLDLSNIITISDEEDDATTETRPTYNTRRQTHDKDKLCYDQKWHPMDDYLQPQRAAKRRSLQNDDSTLSPDDKDDDSTTFANSGQSDDDADTEDEGMVSNKRRISTSKGVTSNKRRKSTSEGTRRSSRETNRDAHYDMSTHRQDAELVESEEAGVRNCVETIESDLDDVESEIDTAETAWDGAGADSKGGDIDATDNAETDQDGIEHEGSDATDTAETDQNCIEHEGSDATDAAETDQNGIESKRGYAKGGDAIHTAKTGQNNVDNAGGDSIDNAETSQHGIEPKGDDAANIQPEENNQKDEEEHRPIQTPERRNVHEQSSGASQSRIRPSRASPGSRFTIFEERQAQQQATEALYPGPMLFMHNDKENRIYSERELNLLYDYRVGLATFADMANDMEGLDRHNESMRLLDGYYSLSELDRFSSNLPPSSPDSSPVRRRHVRFSAEERRITNVQAARRHIRHANISGASDHGPLAEIVPERS
ncbi:hypothetical protein BDV95DRAFT_592766 [Massariosphaeria phaeospora]|uniref:Uncharacterized protein n=1 Tax=Massariosphaeria phaeospora TaxID=100035 RepID=A0A7C8I8L6_9PLEO|nr:hypothetical protein BDV95DRAFT_592766 [Massariosphaeria phaeospora]